MEFRTLISMLLLCQLFIVFPSPAQSNDSFIAGKEEIYDNNHPKLLSAIYMMIMITLINYIISTKMVSYKNTPTILHLMMGNVKVHCRFLNATIS